MKLKQAPRHVDLLFLLVRKTLTLDLGTFAYDKSPLFDLIIDLWPGQSIFSSKSALLSGFDYNWTFSLIFTRKTLLDIFTVISSKLVPGHNFGSTQLTRNPHARWFPIILGIFKQLFLENSLSCETETSIRLKVLVPSFYWCVRIWPLTVEI